MHLKSRLLTKAPWTSYTRAPDIHSPLFLQRLGHSYLSAFALSVNVCQQRMGSSLVSFRSPLRSHFSEAALGRPVQAPGHPTPPPNLRPPASLTLFRFPCVVSHYPNIPLSLSIYLVVGCSLLHPSPPPRRSSFERMCCVCSQLSQGLREVLERNFLAKLIRSPPSP